MTEQEKSIAAEVVRAAKKYIEEHREEYEQWKKERDRDDDKV